MAGPAVAASTLREVLHVSIGVPRETGAPGVRISAGVKSLMSDHPNATLIREMFDAFLAGDVDRIRTTMAEDVVWNFPGRRGQLAGRHEGRDAVFTFLLDVARLTDETFELELVDVIANDRHAVAMFRGSGSRKGLTLDNPTCLKMRIENGQVTELWEFVWDLYHVDEFWS